MVREIHWTEQSEHHISRHNIDEGEVEDVIYTRPRLTLRGRDETTLYFGTTSAGRHLLVVLADSRDGRWYVVTARDMTDRERRTFHEKAR